VRREGRNVARVNGRTVGATLLKEIGSSLVDIHGQSEHLSLLDPHAHLGLLDRYADIQALLSDYRGTYHKLTEVRRELTDLRQAMPMPTGARRC
jgi:DNA repair protein RecN (Recombination protein N)